MTVSPVDAAAPEGIVSVAQCEAWMEKYRATPWNMLSLATAVDKQPSPLNVLASLDWHRRQAVSLLAVREAALRFYADPDTYKGYDDVEETWGPEINEDKGKKARAALAAVPDGPVSAGDDG